MKEMLRTLRAGTTPKAMRLDRLDRFITQAVKDNPISVNQRPSAVARLFFRASLRHEHMRVDPLP
jgi:hypothetical protein